MTARIFPDPISTKGDPTSRHHGWRAPPEAIFFRARPLATIQTSPKWPKTRGLALAQNRPFLAGHFYFPPPFYCWDKFRSRVGKRQLCPEPGCWAIKQQIRGELISTKCRSGVTCSTKYRSGVGVISKPRRSGVGADLNADPGWTTTTLNADPG